MRHARRSHFGMILRFGAEVVFALLLFFVGAAALALAWICSHCARAFRGRFSL